MNPIKILLSFGALVVATTSLSTHAAVGQTATACVPGNAWITAATGVPPGADIYAVDCIGVVEGDINFKDEDLNTPLLDSNNLPNYVTSQVGTLPPAGGDPWNPGAFGRGRVGGVDYWQEKSKDEGGSGNPLGFNVSPGPGDGIDEVTWTTTRGSLTGTWIIRVKQAKESILWLFTGLEAATGGTIKLDNIKDNGWSNIALIEGRRTSSDNGVPAPATWLLLGLGLALIATDRRRRQALLRIG